VAATCDYGGTVNAAFRRGNVFATQFHPEKSGDVGLALLPTSSARREGAGMTAELYPAIDLRGGKRACASCQGDYDQETTYGDDPVAVAASFAEAGRDVDPRGRPRCGTFGSPVNRPWWRPSPTPCRSRTVQTGGGVRTVADAEVLADAGVARVVMGSLRWRARLVAEASGVVAVAVGLDHRDGEARRARLDRRERRAAVRRAGWFPTAAAFVITDIAATACCRALTSTGSPQRRAATSASP
jgi:phosphoribosylformimino-5-aminoimidazole carboxamide ribonucleotide (ProFAR) isomerase